MVYLVKSKDEVPSKIKHYVERAETRWNRKVSKIRCDKEKEYVNNNVITWCKNKGIELDKTVTYTPQLNRRAERLNRTLMEKARALLFDSGLQKEMWGEALYTSVYILNRSPTEAIKTTPYEMWEKKRPNVTNMQLFGCEAHPKILQPIKKLDERSKAYTFVGYAPVGYRLWDKEKRKIIVSRNVRFQEKRKKKSKRQTPQKQ